MRDWRSYDEIADHYDRVWAPRFEAVARRIWQLVPINAHDAVLDLGTGTGVVLRIRAELGGDTSLFVGCDRSPQMLRQARSRLPALRAVIADATVLPFRQQSFDVVTASFVLSHLRNYADALTEIRRVLKMNGSLAVSSWAPASDPYSVHWSECLAQAISTSELERASMEVAPCEEHFSSRAALADVGFSDVTSVALDVASDLTVEQFLEHRELCSTARFGRHLLGPAGWARFRAAVSGSFHNRFGSSFRYCRDAFVAVAKKSELATKGSSPMSIPAWKSSGRPSPATPRRAFAIVICPSQKLWAMPRPLEIVPGP